jgi:hypothetical protein
LRFTVRGPAGAEVSPCCHRPSGGDVACCVDVGIARSRVAGFALENRLALAVSRCDVPAYRASLRRVRGRDLFDPAMSLLLQSSGEQPPTAAADTAIQPTLLCDSHAGLLHGAACTAGHRTHVKRFDADRIEALRDVCGGLFDPVFSTVPLTRFEFADVDFRASAPIGSALRTGQTLLQHLQPPGLTATQAGGVAQFPRRKCHRRDNTAVDAHHAALTRTRDGIWDVGERNVPAASPIAGDPIGLHPFWDLPRQPEADPTDLGHPHLAEPAVQPLDVMRFDRYLPESVVHPGFPPGRAAMRSAEKVAHRLVEVTQRLLLHGVRPCRQPIVLGACGSQLRTLLVVAWRAATGLPMLMLLDGKIPHVSGMSTVLGQPGCLLRGRK